MCIRDSECIYAVPCHATKVLKVDTNTQEVTTIGSTLSSEELKWISCTLCADGCIYGIPWNAKSILKIDPSTDTVTTFGELGEGKLKGPWMGAASGPDGCIYGIPRGAKYVLKIDPGTKTVSTIGDDLSEYGGEAWLVGVLGRYG